MRKYIFIAFIFLSHIAAEVLPVVKIREEIEKQIHLATGDVIIHCEKITNHQLLQALLHQKNKSKIKIHTRNFSKKKDFQPLIQLVCLEENQKSFLNYLFFSMPEEKIYLVSSNVLMDTKEGIGEMILLKKEDNTLFPSIIGGINEK